MIEPDLGSINSAVLPEEDRATFQDLIRQWQNRLDRNILRTRCYNGQNSLKDLGIAIPPQLRNVETVVGWPAKAVDALANRIRFDGFVALDDDDDPLGLNETLEANDFSSELLQATRSTLMHGCSFVSVSNGDTDLGEPVPFSTLCDRSVGFEATSSECGTVRQRC